MIFNLKLYFQNMISFKILMKPCFENTILKYWNLVFKTQLKIKNKK